MNTDSNDRLVGAVASSKREAKIGDRVSVNYTGRFENGVVFLKWKNSITLKK